MEAPQDAPVAPDDPTGELPLIEIIRDPEVATAVLKPPRPAILAALREPDSASGLTRRLELSRQRLSHHFRELEAAGLVRLWFFLGAYPGVPDSDGATSSSSPPTSDPED